MDKAGWEAKEQEELIKEGPLNRVKGFPEVNLSHTSRRSPLPTIVPKQFLHEMDVIRHTPATEKSILRRADNILKGCSHSDS